MYTQSITIFQHAFLHYNITLALMICKEIYQIKDCAYTCIQIHETHIVLMRVEADLFPNHTDSLKTKTETTMPSK